MKSLLSRRPSSASSSKVMDLQGSRSESLSRGQEGDFYYPTTAAATHTSALPSKRASSQPTPRTDATTSISSPPSIGSAPPNRSPPSSWMKNRNRFSVNQQQQRGSTKGGMEGKSGVIGIANGKATTTSARPNGPARSATAPSTVRSIASSYDERVRERFERTEKRQIVPNHLNEEKTTHPSIFRVTNADNASPIDEVQPLVPPDKSPALGELSSKSVVDEPQTTSTNGDGLYLDGTRSPQSEPGLIAKASNLPPRGIQTVSALEPHMAEMPRRENPLGSISAGGGYVEDGSSVNNRMTLSKRLSGITKRASANVLNLSVRTNTHSTMERSKSTKGKEGSAPPVQKMAGPSRAALTPLTPAELACHLKDLAISHADGLLSDEEYRLLRQGLFTRTQIEEESSTTSTTPRASSFWQGATSALDAEPIPTSLKHSPSSPIIRKGIIDVLEEQETLFLQPPSAKTPPTNEKGLSKTPSIGHSSLRLTLTAGGMPLFKRPTSRSCRGKTVGCDQSIQSRSSAIGTTQQSDSTRHQPFKSAGSAASAGSSAGPDRKTSDATTVGSMPASRFGSVKGSDRATQSGSDSPLSFSQSSIKRRLRGVSGKEGEAERKCEAERRVEEARSVRRQKIDTSHTGRERTASSLSLQKRNRLLSSGSSKALSLPRGTEGSSDLPALPPIPVDSTAFLLATAAALDTKDVEYSDKSSDIIEAEIRIVKAEGKRVAFAFQSLEDGLMEKGRKILSQEEGEEGEGGFFGKEELESKLRWLRAGGSEWDAGRPHPSARRETREEAPVRRQPSTLRRLSNNFFPTASSSSSSTHRVTRDLSTSSQPSRDPSTPHLASSSSSSSSPIMQHTPSKDIPLSSHLHLLQKEILDLQTRREDVARRYEDRLAFLASKSRAAKTREKFA